MGSAPPTRMNRMNLDPDLPNPAHWASHLSDADVVALSQSLRQIDPAWMKTENGGHRVWYQGKEPYFDVIFETEDAQITWFQFTFRGRILFWNRHLNRLQTGETEELDVPPLLGYYAASKQIREGAPPDADWLRLVRGMLRARANEPLFQAMADILDGSLATAEENSSQDN